MAPAAASRMKWFAVATMATRIENGYKKPTSTHTRRRQEGSRIRGAKLGWDRLNKGRMIDLDRRCWSGRGIDMMVKPIIKL